MSQEQLGALAPVVGWTSSTITAYGVVFFNFRYLTSPMQSFSKAHESPNFALNAEQLRELGQRMIFLAEQLEKNPVTSAVSPKH